jgi:hypothetical protein
MDTRTAKQLIYGTLYALILFALCAGIWFVFVRPFLSAPVAVCTPSTCAPTSTAPIAASVAATFVTSSGHDTFLAQVANGNADFGVPALDYELDLEDASGTVLQSVPGQSFIYANQNKYLLIPNVAVSVPFDHAALDITGAEWEASSTMGASVGVALGQFSVQNVVASTAEATVSVGGQLANTSVASYRQVIVMVLFKDVNGNIIGASQTELSNVGAGTTTDFSVIYPSESNINPALNQIIVYAIQ